MLRISLVLALTALLTSCGGGKKASLPPDTKPVASKDNAPAKPKETAAAKEEQTRLFGQVTSPNKTLLLFQTSGSIKTIYARPGMFFKKGDVLAELDARDQALRADMAKFRYLQALNQQKIAERDYNISKQLHEQKIDSKVAFENAEIAYNNAVLNASIAETDMKTANKALSDTKLRAPYDCVVSRQLKSLGESSMGGPENGAAYEVFDSSPPELVLNAPESLLGEVKVGQDIEIIVTALQLKLPATVVRFVPIIATDNRNFVIVAHLKTADKRVVPGYFVEGVLKARRKSGKSL